MRTFRRIFYSKKFAIACFITPAMILFSGFILYPLISSLFYSIYEWDGLTRIRFVGLENFKTLLFSGKEISERFWNAVSHNAYSLVFVTTLQMCLGIFFALLLFQKVKGHRFFQTLFFLPVVLSVVLVGFLFNLLLHPIWGVFNQLIRIAGFKDFYFPWLGNPKTVLTVILLVNIWRWAGFPTLVFLAGLNNIPKSIMEAADLDGATGFTKLKSVTIPLLIPQILIVLILTITGNLMMFDIIFALAGPAGEPNYSADVLGTLFYRTAFGGKYGLTDKGLGTSIAVIMLMIMAVFSVFVVTILQRRRTEL